MGNVELYIEGNKIELFDNESINITSSVQNINDISKVFADVSKSFSVPASKVNNSYFKHYYDASITNGFDARTKKEAVIYLNSIRYKKGKIRFQKAVLKNNEISSYQIQFEGEVVKIKDVLGDDKLRDLDLSAYNHSYTSANIKQGLETSLFSGAITYPLISPVRRFLYDSSDTITSNDSQVNIHYNVGIIDNSIEYTEVKPAISIVTLFDVIQNDYGLSFVGDFFNRDYFTKAYMWLSNNEGLLKTTNQNLSNIVDWDGGSNTYVDLGTNVFTPIVNNLISTQYFVNTITVTPGVGFENTVYNIVILKDGVESVRLNDATGTTNINFNFTGVVGQVSEADYTFFIETSQSFSYTSELEQVLYENGSPLALFNTTASLNNIIGEVIVANQMPDIKIYDFLVGIIKMFNIALTANFDDSINWEVLPEWYNQGKVFTGFEKYIDVNKKDVKRGKLNNEFAFNFEEPKTILAQQFDSNNGIAYGDLEAKLFDDNGVLLDGDKLEIKLPFENLIYERILDLDNNTFTDLQYGYAVDKEQTEVVTAPVLFYNNNIPVDDVGFLNDLGGLENLSSTINIPSNTVSISDSDTQTMLFGAEVSTYTFNVMNTSLYISFYQDYVTDMFSNQRRVYTFDAIIPEHLLTNINLNDRLIILNTRYIINSINSNLTDGKTKLELLNDIYTSGDLITDQFYVTPNINFAARWEDTYTATVYSSRQLKILSTDEGDGLFITINSPSDVENTTTINYTVQSNNSGVNRSQSITIQDKNTLEVIKVFITQSAESIITADNNIVTADNNIITADNG